MKEGGGAVRRKGLAELGGLTGMTKEVKEYR